MASCTSTASQALMDRRSPLTGTCNGSFVAICDVDKPVSQIVPIASHVGLRFKVAEAFDVNPVVWHVLEKSAIAVRGNSAADLGLSTEPRSLGRWNLDNLNTYWRRWADCVVQHRRTPSGSWRLLELRSRCACAWGVLGAPRLHCTISTGRVITKEQAAHYALEVFDPKWHPIIREALAYWRNEGKDPGGPALAPRLRLEQTGAFVREVVDSANKLIV